MVEVLVMQVNINPRYRKLLESLREARELLARPDNEFAWSSWEDALGALREIDGLILRIESGDMPKRSELEFLFLPTGPIQEVSESSGWGEEFLSVANRFDKGVEIAYSTGVIACLRRLVSWY